MIMASFLKRISIIFVLAAAFVFISTFFVQSNINETEANNVQRKLLDFFEFYSDSIRNTRFISQRYDMLSSNSQYHGFQTLGVGFIQNLMLQAAYAQENAYLLLRSIDGSIVIAVHRGVLFPKIGSIKIDGEENFKRYNDTFLQRSCLIKRKTYVCLVDIPNIPAFATPHQRTYTVIALSISDLLLHLQYRQYAPLFPFSAPTVVLQVGEKTLPLSYGILHSSFLLHRQAIGKGIVILAGSTSVAFVINGFLATLALTFFIFSILFLIRRSSEKKARLYAEIEASKTLGYMAAQVAHDIRSPLTRLDVCCRRIDGKISEQEMKVLTFSIKDLRNIANNMLVRYQKENMNKSKNEIYQREEASNKGCFVLLPSLIEEMIAQKNNEWTYNPCEISFKMEDLSKRTWLFLVPVEFKRMLSNLLNNAHEALEALEDFELNGIMPKAHGPIEDKAFKIEITVTIENDRVRLSVKDSGSGIQEDRIPFVLEGKSFKREGNGLGLSGAKKHMEEIGGKLVLTSVFNQGTCIDLYFPLRETPGWFPSALQLSAKQTILVIDDALCMHNFWRQHIEALGLKAQHFLEPEDLLTWSKENPEKLITAILISDYELRHDTETGFSLLEKFNLGKRGYLVTSHAEDPYLQERCSQLGVWLVPKSCLEEIRVSREDS